MDAPFYKDLFAPVLLSVITGLVAYIFGRQKYRRDASATQLTEAQDTEQVTLMKTMRERETDALRREREALISYYNVRDELAKTRADMNGEMQSLRGMGERRDMLLSRQGKQLSILARMLAAQRPELQELIQESGFVALDDLPTRRRTDPSAIAGPIRLKKERE